MKIKYLFLFAPLFIILTGCDHIEEREKKDKERFEKRVISTEVIDLGVVDGCNVKKHYKLTPNENFSEKDKDDYDSYDYHSFYIAKCDGNPTTTTTQQVGGKQKHDEAMIKVDKK